MKNPYNRETRPNKLSENQKREIVHLIAVGISRKKIATMFNVASSLVSYYEKRSERYEISDEEMDAIAAKLPPLNILEA